MGSITNTDVSGLGPTVISVLTLGASDTLTFNPDKRPLLIINNITAGAITPNIDGDAALATYRVDGVGPIDLTAGYDYPAAIAAGAYAVLRLSQIRNYLEGTVTITSADGAEAMILEF